jgi:glycosyltransferase involved in cell wall biosynthesis
MRHRRAIVYTAHSIDRAEVEAGEWLPHGSIQDDVLLGADRVIALSQSELGRLRAYYSDIRNRVHVVGNGICEPPRLPRRPPKDTIDILYVGRFANRKGMVDLFEALAIVARASPATRFLFVGGGGRARRPEPVRALGYGRARGHVTGPRRCRHRRRWARRDRRSRRDGARRRTAKTRRPGAALLDLCGDEELRLGRAARRVVAERYSWGQVVCALEAVYDASCRS